MPIESNVSKQGRSRARMALTAAAAAVGFSFCLPARADESWLSGSGNWSDVSNWSAGVEPGSDDNVFITNNDAASRVITLDTDSTVYALTLGNSGGGTNEFDVSGDYTLQLDLATLNSNALVEQSAGTLSFASRFDQGPMGYESFFQVNAGTEYDLSGTGVLSPLIMSIGGTFNQTGGTLTASDLETDGIFNQNGGTLTAGALASEQGGQYTLGSATLNVTGEEDVGAYAGNATFTQNGGVHTVGGSLIVGRDTSSGSTVNGTLTLNSGSLTVNGNVLIGGNDQYYQPGDGTLAVTGGAMTVTGSTTVAATGNFSQSGGAFQTGSLANAGTFSVNGSNAVIGTGVGVTALSNTGTIILYNNATVNVLGKADLPGTVISDPSTIIFHDGVTLDSSGVIHLGAGDQWVIAGGDFINNSTSSSNTVAGATLAFTGNGTQNLVLGSSTAAALVWGAVEIGSSTSLNITDGSSNPAQLLVDDVIIDGNSLPNLSNITVEDATALTGAQSISADRTNPASTDAVWTDDPVNPSNNGDFVFSNNATYTNSGTFEVENDRNFTGSGTFNNTGTFRKQASGGTTVFAIPFNNHGLIDVRSGTLSMEAGGSGAGTAAIASGATLAISGSTFTSSGALDTEGNLIVTGTTANVGPITGAGSVYVTGGGTSTLNTPSINVGSLGLYYGDLGLTTAGSSSTVTNATLNYANIVGSAPDGTTVQSDPSTLTVTGVFSNSISINLNNGIVLNLAGTGDIAGDNIGGDYNSAVNILPGAVITHNSTGSTYFQQPLTTIEGELDVNAGSVYVFNGGEHSGTVKVASGATAEITGGFSSAASIDDSGTFTFVNTPGPDTDPAVVYTGHTFNGNLTVEDGATLGFDSIGAPGATFFSKTSTITLGSNTTLNSISGSTAVFNNPQALNFGTVNVAGGVTFRNTSFSANTFTSSGYVQIETGQPASPSEANSATAKPSLSGGTGAGATATIATLNMSGGIFRSGYEDNLPTTISVDNFNLSGGAVGANIVVNKTMDWTGGNIGDNYGNVVVSPNATVTISQDGGQVSQQGQWDPRGTVNAQGNVTAGWDIPKNTAAVIGVSQAAVTADDDTVPTNSVVDLTGKMDVSGAFGIGDGGTIDNGTATSKGTVYAHGQSQLTASSIAVGNTSGGYGLLAIADSATVTTPVVQNAGMITQSGGMASLGNVDGMTGTIATTGGKLTANYIRQKMLSVSSGASVAIAVSGTTSGTSVLSGLSIDSASTVDLANNDLILNHASGDTTSLAMIKSAIHQAYDGGKWDQPGLTSSMAAANPGYGLGYAEASDLGSTSFDGQSVSNAVLVKYTLNGDLDLSGSVDQNDIAKLAPNYGQSVSKGWSQGDVNGDGVVDQNDIALIAPNYGQSVGSTSSAMVHALAVKPAVAVRSQTAVQSQGALYTWDAALASPSAGTVLLKVDNTPGDPQFGDVILQGNSASLYTIYITSASGNLNTRRYNSLGNQYDAGTGAVGVIGDDNTPKGTGLFSIFSLASNDIEEAGLGVSLDFNTAAESIDLTNGATSHGTGLFAGLVNGSADLSFEWSGQSGQLVPGEVEYSSPTPEPGSLPLLAIGSLTLLRRRKRA